MVNVENLPIASHPSVLYLAYWSPAYTAANDTFENSSKREAKVYAPGSEKHGQVCQSVDAGVMAIGDERSAPDLIADVDAKDRNDLVARKPDQ